MRPEFEASGMSWDERASLPDDLGAVLDPAGSRRKNAYINAVHLQALAKGIFRLKGGRALDFGCGTGRVSRWLASKHWNVVGIDISSEMLKRAADLSDSDGISFLQSDGLFIPTARAAFDLVAVVYVIQISMKQPETVKEIATELGRVLKPGGRLVCISITDYFDLSVSRYRELVEVGGFDLVFHKPVRMRRSRLLKIAINERFPNRLIRTLARLSPLECRFSLRKKLPPNEWWDHLYVWTRK